MKRVWLPFSPFLGLLFTLSLACLLTCLAPASARAGGEPAAPAPPDTLAAVRARGELRWGADAQGGAPYVFQDPMDPNHLIGFEVDLAAALAKRLGVRPRPVQGQWEGLLDLLDRGDFDVALNGIEVAGEKRRTAELSRPYFAAAERLTVRRGDAAAPRSLEALRGRRVGTLPGSLAARILERAAAEVKTYEGGQNDIYDDLRIGRTDAVLLDEPITRYYGAIDPALEVVDGAFGEIQYALALRKGDRPMVEAVDRALGALAADGTLAAIYARWGLWNPETARLLGGPAPPATALAEA
jgi:polar amino acid transport system substrate-binding protein